MDWPPSLSVIVLTKTTNLNDIVLSACIVRRLAVFVFQLFLGTIYYTVKRVKHPGWFMCTPVRIDGWLPIVIYDIHFSFITFILIFILSFYR